MKTIQNADKFLKICKWASKRYAVNGLTPIYVGGEPSVYKRIESAAWSKYF